MLSRVITHVTGEGVLDVLRPRLLRPLGLPEEVPWHRDPPATRSASAAPT